jgi:hypothetical protein
MARRRSIVVAWLVAFLAAGAVSMADGPEDAAQSAADGWLGLVDSGNYAASWDQAARPLKGAMKQADWVQQAEAARAPLGKLVSRRLKSRQYTEKAPTTRVIGGRVYTWGDGQYVVLQYDSAFANKASAGETVTAMADADGSWRVAGYSIR